MLVPSAMWLLCMRLHSSTLLWRSLWTAVSPPCPSSTMLVPGESTGETPSPSASGSGPIPTQNPLPSPWAGPWGAGEAQQVVPRALSPAPALSLIAGRVVGLYSRFDVIVSTCVLHTQAQAWPLACDCWGAHTYLCPCKPTPCAVTPQGSVSHAVPAQQGARTHWGTERGHLSRSTWLPRRPTTTWTSACGRHCSSALSAWRVS